MIPFVGILVDSKYFKELFFATSISLFDEHFWHFFLHFNELLLLDLKIFVLPTFLTYNECTLSLA